MKKVGLVVGVVLVAGMMVNQIEAKSSFKKQFVTDYPQASVELGKCTLCHVMPGYGTHNNFSVDFMNNGHDFKAIEQMDSDDDGFSNIEEINAKTQPGDAESKPQE